MTKETFEIYLQSVKNKIVDYHNRPILNRYFFEVPDEWLSDIVELLNELFTTTWSGRILQCKEKYGTFRFYIEEGNDEIYSIIERYEKRLFQSG